MPSGVTAKYDFVDGKYLYNRCHLIGWQLTAENANRSNLITGTRYMNVDGMLPFENMVADYIKETGSHVMYRVSPIFNGDDLVAQGVQMEAYSVEDDGEGICFNVFCYNVQPGVTIDYADGTNHLTDSLGRSVDFKNTIIIMTSNIGTRQLKDFGNGIGFNTGGSTTDFAHGVIQKALNKTFSPEFLNRVDDIVMFNELDKQALNKIIDIELGGFFKRVKEMGYTLDVTENARNFLVEKGYDKQFGARPLKRAVQQYLEDDLAEMILRAEVEKGNKIIVDHTEGNERLTCTIADDKD